MKYAVRMDSGAMMYIPSFIKISSGTQKLIAGDIQTHSMHGDHMNIRVLSFCQNKESRLKKS
jgi:hypothetical protein